MNVEALNQACQHFGGQKKLATVLGIHSAAISSWRKIGSVPPIQCRAIEAATMGKVRREDLDPILFGPISGLDPMPSARQG